MGRIRKAYILEPLMAGIRAANGLGLLMIIIRLDKRRGIC